VTTIDAPGVMARGLTPVYRRGLERLPLLLGATAGDGTTAIHAYDFQGYVNLYNRLPDSPRYLLVPNQSSSEPRTVRVWYEVSSGATEASVDVGLPAGWAAGRGVAVAIPGPGGAITNQLRLTRFQPQAPAGQLAADWSLVALLGNLAKLLWVVGWEHDELGLQAADVAAQRNAASAHGASLDLLGRDLGVPRFPPTAYTWDPDTLALYHLDAPGPSGEVVDARSRYQPTSHPGTPSGVEVGRPGRFGGAYGFRTKPAQIVIADHPDFLLPATASFTVEAIVKPDRAVIAAGAVIAKRAQLNTVAQPGWALTMGSFPPRGFAHNLRFSVSDGTQEVELFSDSDLGDGVFHHVAGVIDRRTGPPAVAFVRLYVDGVEVATQALAALGALTNAEPVRIGFGQESGSDAQYLGLVDEVRLFKLARSDFHPVVGEGDDQYRRRLRVFQRWVLPTPDALQATLNEMAGPVANDPQPFMVDEKVDPMAVGTLSLRVLPKPLGAGQCISADGNTRSSEAAAVGTAADDDFAEAWLVRHPDRPGLAFAPDPAEATRRMQQVTVQTLDALCDRLVPVGGNLTVLRSYDPAAADLHRVGRALLLIHDTLGAGDLAVHAHAAGFGWVCPTAAGQVHVAQSAGPAYRILPPEPAKLPPPPDVIEGQDLSLDLDPKTSPFADADVRWSLVHCGFGDATLSADNPPKLHALAAGDVAVQIEVVRRRHTGRARRRVRIGLADFSLSPGDSIAGDGRRGVTEAAAAGDPEPGFSEAYLVTRYDDYPGQANAGKVDYGASLGNRRLQLAAAAALDRLLVLLTNGKLTVVKAYDPATVDLHKVGRALVLEHDTLTPSALAARAFAAGFDFVRVDPGPAQIQVAVRLGEPIAISAEASEVAVGGSVGVAVVPQAQPIGVCFSADGARAYVADHESARVTGLRLTANPPTAFPQLRVEHTAAVPVTPRAVAFGGGNLYVAREFPGTISVLDPVTLAPSNMITTGSQPTAMAADGDRLFVGCAGDKTLRAYDVASNLQVGSSLNLPDQPLAIAPVPGGTDLFVVIAGDRFCQVGRAALNLINTFATGKGAAGAAVTPDGKKLYLACSADDPANQTGAVLVYDTANVFNPPKRIAGFQPQLRPLSVVASGDQKFVYVTTTGAGAVSGRVHVIDATDTLLPQLFTPGSTTRQLAVSPNAATYQRCLLAVSTESSTVTLADPAPLSAVKPRGPRVAANLALGSGGADNLAWSTVPFSRGRVELSSLVRPNLQVRGVAAGAALIRAIYFQGNGLRPYQFAVRLNPTLESQPNVVIRKDQYDLVMNVLNWFCPIGVEVRTELLRAHVVELADLLAGDLFPGYTYPVYHQPGLPPPVPTNPTLEG
jgi:DNA-binding beta-propeller fold protein YncE